MHPTIKTFLVLKIMFYCNLMEKKRSHYQEHQLVQKTKRRNNQYYVNTLGKPYSQIVFYLCIESEFKETFDNNCETAISAQFKNQAKLMSSIPDNGNVNDETLDNFFNVFSFDYLNPTNNNNQELTLNNETPIFKSRTTTLSITKKLNLR